MDVIYHLFKAKSSTVRDDGGAGGGGGAEREGCFARVRVRSSCINLSERRMI